MTLNDRIARAPPKTRRFLLLAPILILLGLALLALHSAHYSKIFRRLLGTSCSLKWRNEGERELVWTVDPTHPVAADVPLGIDEP